jgi:bifunctional UDP-N-acetylglucosamine 2-epimerase / N-acetylmannosamine kinase
MKKISVVISARPSYSRVKSFLTALENDSEFYCQIALTQSAVLRNFGDLTDLLTRDGFKDITVFHNSLAENTPLTMALNTALSLQDLAKWFASERPDAVVVIADRYETISVSIAAAYQNIPLVHIQGGEVTGNIDEKVRHANTKLADVHLVSNFMAAKRVENMGENPSRVFVTGCPSLDIVDRTSLRKLRAGYVEDKYGGVGGKPSFEGDYSVVLLHPETENPEKAREQVDAVYSAVRKTCENIVWFWPNVDAGSDLVSKYLREVVGVNKRIRFYRSFDPSDYLSLIYYASFLIGNSSSGIREAGFLGIPVINVGQRQDLRDRSENVLDVGFDEESIIQAIRQQQNHGKYPVSDLYGDGSAGQKMVGVLKELSWPIDFRKRLYNA